MHDQTEGRRIALVGNAPEIGDWSGRIDTADRVVRINDAHGLNGPTGARTTDLFLVNSGGSMRERLDDPTFTDRQAFRDAERLWLPIDPGHVDLFDPPATEAERAGAAAEDWTDEARERFEAAGKRVELLPADLFARACEAIGTRMRVGMAPPSTGYLAAFALLEGPEDGRLECFGFGFEGWEAHNWSGEQRWFERRHAEGRLTLHPLDPSEKMPDRETMEVT